MPSASALLRTQAVVLDQPEQIRLREVELSTPGAAEVIVEIDHSGISTGTERLLWNGRMPAFPGMGYPLVPGYESVGRVVQCGAGVGLHRGQTVFVPGSTGFKDVRGLFGGAARRVVVSAARVIPVDPAWGDSAALLALAATAHHALAGAAVPDLIVGHGSLGRLMSRIAVAMGGSPTVWETSAARRAGGAAGVQVIDPADDDRHDYRCICDASGDAGLVDGLIARLAPGGEIVLAGFYETPVAFNFARAFLREPRLRVAAQWQPADLRAAHGLVTEGRLSLQGLVTHLAPAAQAADAYRTAFDDAACLKMVLDWRQCA